MVFKRLSILICVLLLSACAQTELASHVAKKTEIFGADVQTVSTSKGTFKTGRTYRIKGRSYTPKETYDFTETGMASWYGPNFHGKKTANGEIYDQYALTAAHKTLQMPSIIKVTNLENGRTAVLRVNDRGPFSKGRVLDVSKRGAEKLGFKHQGTARVRIELLKQESLEVARIAKGGRSTQGYEIALNQRGYKPKAAPKNDQPIQLAKTSPRASATPPTPTTKPDQLFVQAGAFSNPVRARAFAERVRVFGPSRISPKTIDGNQLYRVQIGPLNNQSEADLVMTKIASTNIGEPILIRE